MVSVNAPQVLQSAVHFAPDTHAGSGWQFTAEYAPPVPVPALAPPVPFNPPVAEPPVEVAKGEVMPPVAKIGAEPPVAGTAELPPVALMVALMPPVELSRPEPEPLEGASPPPSLEPHPTTRINATSRALIMQLV
jgi:hypothetical protein